MKWLHTIVVLTLAILWLPVSVHCELEQIPGLNFLSCCPDESAAPHQDDDCQTDGCAVVESGLYKVEDRQTCLPAPDLVRAAYLSGPVEIAVSVAEPLSGPPGLSRIPAELPRTWQFSLRAALPPRAPSSAS